MIDPWGIRTDPKFRVQFRATPAGPTHTRFPSPDAGYFEQTFVLQAVLETPPGEPLTVLELGAGYGYRLVVAATARSWRKPGP